MQLFPSPTVPTPQAATISNPQVDLASPIGQNCETFFPTVKSVSQSVSQLSSRELDRLWQSKGFKIFFSIQEPIRNAELGPPTNQLAKFTVFFPLALVNEFR